MTETDPNQQQGRTHEAEPRTKSAAGHPAPARAAPHPVFWVIAVALVVIATSLVLKPGSAPILMDSAMGQPVLSGAARGVFAFSGQLTKNTFGVFVVDVDAATIWSYEYVPGQECLRLAAARSWRYDRFLENHNLCDLPPEVVEKMVEEQRKYKLQAAQNEMP